MYDVSARPCVQPGVLTFAVPMPGLVRMIDNADGSFLATPAMGKGQESDCRENRYYPVRKHLIFHSFGHTFKKLRFV